MHLIRKLGISKQNFNAPKGWPETLELQHEASTDLIRELGTSKQNFNALKIQLKTLKLQHNIISMHLTKSKPWSWTTQSFNAFKGQPKTSKLQCKTSIHP